MSAALSAIAELALPKQPLTIISGDYVTTEDGNWDRGIWQKAIW